MKRFLSIFIITFLILGIVLGLQCHKNNISFNYEDHEVVTLEYESSPPIITAKYTSAFNSNNVNLNVEMLDNFDFTILGKQTIRYSANYKKHSKVLSITYNVVDSISPTLTLNGEEKVTIAVGGIYQDKGCIAFDNFDGDISNNITQTSNLDTNSTGTYEIVYSVSDSSGNTSSISRIIEVIPSTNKERIIYLTFDDGPCQYTERLISILDKYNIKATFFVTNIRPSYVNMISKAYNSGHSIGVHSYTHKYNIVYQSEEAYWNDFNKMNEIIKQQTGSYTKLFRFPGGASNTVSRKYTKGIMASLTMQANNKGYKYCDWNVSSGDAGGANTATEVYQNVIKGCSKRNISWVLMHDVNSFTVDAVEDIIIWGLNNGYTFLPLTTSSPLNHHKVNN